MRNPAPPALLHPSPGSPEELALWQSVLANQPLLTASAACDPADVAKVEQLRKKGAVPEIRVALALAIARKKAAAKLPARWAAQVTADPQAVEQASSWEVARWKAERFKGAASVPARLLDLCCGAGFDALAFADAGFHVEACDLNPVRAWMAERNATLLGENAARLRVVCKDAGTYADEGIRAPFLLHLDPARRTESGRIFQLEDYLPPPAIWAPLLRQAAGGCVKLAPGVAHAELAGFADSLGLPWSSSFVSDDGRLVQALLWTGALAHAASREAVLIEGGRVHTLAGTPGAPMMFDSWSGEPAFLFEADDAVERAQLSAELSKQHGLFDLHPGLGLLAGNQPAASPWFTGFQVLEAFSWDEKKARVALKTHNAGLVEVKTRGQACDPNALEKKLRGEGSERLTVFALRLGGSLRGFVTKRIR